MLIYRAVSVQDGPDSTHASDRTDDLDVDGDPGTDSTRRGTDPAAGDNENQRPMTATTSASWRSRHQDGVHPLGGEASTKRRDIHGGTRGHPDRTRERSAWARHLEALPRRAAPRRRSAFVSHMTYGDDADMGCVKWDAQADERCHMARMDSTFSNVATTEACPASVDAVQPGSPLVQDLVDPEHHGSASTRPARRGRVAARPGSSTASAGKAASGIRAAADSVVEGGSGSRREENLDASHDAVLFCPSAGWENDCRRASFQIPGAFPQCLVRPGAQRLV